MQTFFIIFALNIAGFFIIYFILRGKIEKKYNADKIVKRVHDEINSIITEMNRTTEMNINLVENKILQLKDITDKTGKKITLFQKENEKQYKAQRVLNKIINKPPVNNITSVENTNTPKKVLKLYNEGISIEMIAKKLGLPISETELIISMKGKK